MFRRLFRSGLLATVFFLAACSGDKALPEPVRLSCREPGFLRPGDTVALISPSYFTDRENVDRAAEVLRGWGFVPVIGAHVDNHYLGKYAGTPKERVSDIRWALEDPSIKAIICNRGGYGTIRLVDMLGQEELSAHPKWLSGFSDITTLHGMETRAGVMSIHGTMGSFLAKSGGTDPSSTLLRDILTGTIPEYVVPAHPDNRRGKATGTLVGGNICTFAPILGTEADATRGEDIILFIEEVEESLHNIDRLFNMLILNGVMDRCRGVILGEFTDCDADLDFATAEEMLSSYLRDYDIPVCCGFPAGHGDVNLPLIMGAPVTLEVRAENARVTFHVEGTKKEVRTEQATAGQKSSTDERRMLAGDKNWWPIRVLDFLKHYEGQRGTLAGKPSVAPHKPVRRAIILGFDGLAGFAVDSADMPCLRSLMDEGSWTTRKHSVLPSSSAVNWATMLMGAGPEVHGYIAWDSREPAFTPAQTGPNGMPPTLFTLFREARPDAESACTYQWDGIKYVIDTAAVSMHRQFPGTEEGIEEELAFVRQYIVDKEPELALFTWDYPDHTGHSAGWYTPDYYAMLSRLDKVIEGVVLTLFEEGMIENTLLIVTSDHGGHRTGHGAPLPSDIYAPFVAYGGGIQEGHQIEAPMYQYDVAATVAHYLDLDLPDSWRGRPILEIFE